jgi:hypothetical protein
MQAGVVLVGSNGKITGGNVPGGNVLLAAVASELTSVKAPLGSVPLL